MNNENKSIFENDAANNIVEEEIVLAPPAEWIEEAKAIAQNTQDNESSLLCLHTTPIKMNFYCQCCIRQAPLS